MLFMKGTPDQPQCGFSFQVVKVLQYHGTIYVNQSILHPFYKVFQALSLHPRTFWLMRHSATESSHTGEKAAQVGVYD